MDDSARIATLPYPHAQPPGGGDLAGVAAFFERARLNMAEVAGGR